MSANGLKERTRYRFIINLKTFKMRRPFLLLSQLGRSHLGRRTTEHSSLTSLTQTDKWVIWKNKDNMVQGYLPDWTYVQFRSEIVVTTQLHVQSSWSSWLWICNSSPFVPVSDILPHDEICFQDLLGGRSSDKFTTFVRPTQSLEVKVHLSWYQKRSIFFVRTVRPWEWEYLP